MNALENTSTFSSSLSRIALLLKKKGFLYIARVAMARLALHVEIRVRGQRKTISLDGCTFSLGEVPNTSMKLNLLRGSYEAPERDAARRYMRPEWPIVELGGCIGVVACITNKLLIRPERHVVVEANPLVIAQLEANRTLNRCSFSIVNRALAYDSASVRLMPSPDFWGTSLYEQGSSRPIFDVPATQLRQIIEDSNFESFALICDIEGQEYELVKNELEVLRKAKVIVMELHPNVIGENKVAEMIRELSSIGFEISERMGSVVVMGRP